MFNTSLTKIEQIHNTKSINRQAGMIVRKGLTFTAKVLSTGIVKRFGSRVQ